LTGSWLKRFETRVIESYALSARDLAIYRIVYAAFVLVAVVPVASWVPAAPRAFFNPPIGPAALFTHLPPASLMLGLNALLTLFAALLLVGWRTGLASAGTGLTLCLLDVWRYSLGKIDHDILLVLAPLVLGFSGWGRALSVDAAKQPAPEGSHPNAEAWPVALFALLVAFAMFTSGWAKATTGWLNPKSLCTYGHLATNYLVTGRETWAAKIALSIHSPWIWKAADWATVALELAVLPAVVRRRSFCLVLAVATLFHVGVMLLFDISFRVNIIAYAAFVRFGRLPLWRPAVDADQLWRKAAPALLVVSGAWGLVGTFFGAGLLRGPLDEIIVATGGLVGAVYLLRAAVGWCRDVLPRAPQPMGSTPIFIPLESVIADSKRGGDRR
jgi:Vitamin K-dependent gamma-carboxylase